MFYTVLEIQQASGSDPGCIPTIYTDYNAALAKFYTVCSVAVVGTLPYHACYILSSEGVITDARIFDRREL